MSAPHDRPTAAELVEAVRELLERDVLDVTDGQVRFHVRVAVNVLRMVERELAEGPVMAEAHARRLEQVGFTSDAELAAAIRAGVLDSRYEEIKAMIHDSVLDKLRVANPDYLEPEDRG
ncbi:DUF6285 domain-containing protein [Rhabdothermincola sp.]|uniref:DUF6285 domain-containing protein n=1 Tax=Rhabdothermincola sp. TaxID=2820405 RepID=UPI002FE403F8